MLERPENPKAVFEEYSHFVKQNKFDPNEEGVKHRVEEKNKVYSENLSKISHLLEFEKKVLEGDEEPPEKKESAVQNVQELFLALRQTGINFGDDQAHLLQKSLNELAFGFGAK